MSKSLADLRANPPKSRPERSVTICLAPHLVAEVQALTDELANMPTYTPPAAADGDRTGPPKRSGQGEDPRAPELRDRLALLLDEMAEHEGELRLRATSDGEWRRWANEHPGREEGQPGHKRDQEVTYGYCDADALIDTLGTYAHSWNGETLGADDWAMLAGNIGGPDLKQIATSVVAMHESRLDFRQWRSGLSATLRRSNVSASPATSASPRAGSTGGKPRKSSAATTKKATASRSPKPGK